MLSVPNTNERLNRTDVRTLTQSTRDLLEMPTGHIPMMHTNSTSPHKHVTLGDLMDGPQSEIRPYAKKSVFRKQ